MRYIFVLVYWVLTYGAHAQTYPVQVTTTLIPPYSPVLSYYTAADANNLQVIIHVMELDRRDLRAKLRVTIEGAGVRLYTSPAYVPPALVLQGGVPEMLSGFDIRGYLNPNNLIFEGITRAEFIKSGKLPEGFYTFTIEVLEYNRSVRISNQSRANAWVVLNDPPLINFPFSGDKLRTTDPQNISFSWVGRHLASPNSAFSTEYEFTLYELYPGQTNPEVAVRSSNSIYRTTTTQSSLYYGPAEPQLIPGKKYAYRIRAYDVSGRDLFKNQGYSETNWFQYGDDCLPLRSVTAEALDPYRIRISWEPEATHTGFVVSYREAGTDTWWKETTFSTSLVIPDLKRGTSYEYQVMGQCNQYEGETSTIQTISTEAEETEDPNFACGTDLIMPELSPNPLQKPLLPLDLFHIGGLDVVVHTVTLNADGSYSGMGHAPMPIFNGAGMRVKIRNVIINEDYYAIAGSVVTVYDTEGRFIVGNTDDLKGDLSEEDAAEDTTTTDAPDDNLLAVEGEIGHVEVIAGELVVTDAEGNPMDIGTVELPAEGETLTLEDASGDTWVVDSEGNVTPGAGNGSTDPNTPGAVGSDVELDYIVTFSPSEKQTYGFDEKTQSTLSGYNQTQLNGENHWIAWKSVESGHTDYVQVTAEDQDEFPEYIGFKTPTGTIPSQPGKDKNTRELTLSGILAGNPTTLTAYATQEDEEGNATEVTLGRLDVVAYDMERQKVVIVPVNDAQTPDASALYESLNKIYAQAVAHWEVVVDHAYSVEPEVLQTLDEGESGLLSSFPKNMKQFQQDFKKSRDLDKDAYYLFLIPGSGARAGFMPFKRQYGYIWTGATSDVPRTIAHELAHGAFRLRHTFSPEAFIATQGSTNNLMDYSSGATHLYKHQWDNVHNPESVASWLQDDEEGAMSKDFEDYLTEIINLYWCAKANSSNYFTYYEFNKAVKNQSFLWDSDLLDLVKLIRSTGSAGVYDYSTSYTDDIYQSGNGRSAHTYYTLDFSRLNSNETLELCFNSEEDRTSFKNQVLESPNSDWDFHYSRLSESLSNAIERSSYDDILTILLNLPSCGFEELSSEMRVRLIAKLLDETWTDGVEEVIILKLINEIPEVNTLAEEMKSINWSSFYSSIDDDQSETLSVLLIDLAKQYHGNKEVNPIAHVNYEAFKTYDFVNRYTLSQESDKVGVSIKTTIPGGYLQPPYESIKEVLPLSDPFDVVTLSTGGNVSTGQLPTIPVALVYKMIHQQESDRVIDQAWLTLDVASMML
ncbi:fibronectin type III domain-containing protein [Marinoscillum luteum]|uniref:Fibronectin type III domain-containing protein n=1 Tax=Marinoscillum luteum TaxID=861051 RepID=A0ABW7NCI5_9BACT